MPNGLARDETVNNASIENQRNGRLTILFHNMNKMINSTSTPRKCNSVFKRIIIVGYTSNLSTSECNGHFEGDNLILHKHQVIGESSSQPTPRFEVSVQL